MSDHAADDTVPEVDESRRKFLIAATAGTGAVGAVLTAVPFVASWKPSESARAAGLPTEVDLSKIEPGQMATFFWRKQQIYVVKRTPEMLASLSKHRRRAQGPEVRRLRAARIRQERRARDQTRSAGAHRHLHASRAVCPRRASRRVTPRVMANWPGGFFCPCHGSKFDLAGRVFEGSPASVNLKIPPYSFEGDNKLVIGVDATAAKGVA